MHCQQVGRVRRGIPSERHAAEEFHLLLEQVLNSAEITLVECTGRSIQSRLSNRSMI